METARGAEVSRQLRRAALRLDCREVTDAQLLDWFLTQRDEAAFAAIVRRHGPMVLGVCRRVLRHGHDAEDAFQATFLVLARKAASLRERELLGNWLYGVAYRAALEAKAARRRVKEKSVSVMPEPEPRSEEESLADLLPHLDRELSRLPEKYRVPVVLCDLEGRTRREAARQLGIPEGTLSGRLTTARRTLARRLARHHPAVVGATVAALLSQTAPACPPAPLVSSTASAATRITAGAATSAVVSAKVAALTEGVLKTMLLCKLNVATLLVLVAALVGLGVGHIPGPTVVAQQGDAKPADGKADAKEAPAWQIQKKLEGHKDRVLSATYSRDGKLLATASKDGTVKIWEPATGKLVTTLKGHEGEVMQVAFAPDGKSVATAGEDKTARVWELPRGAEVQKVTHTHPVNSAHFTPDGKTLIAGGGTVPQPKIGNREAVVGEGELHLWDPATGKERGAVTAGHAGGVTYMAFTPDAKTLVTGGNDNTVRVWEWDGKDKLKETRSIEVGTRQGLYGMALSPDGKTVAATTDGGMLKLYDVATGKEREALEKVGEGLWNRVSFSPDGKTLASNYWIQERDGDFMVNRRALVRLWDVATGKVLETVEVKEVILTVAFAPDGKSLVAAGRGKMKYPVKGDVIILKPGDVEEEKEGPVLILAPKKK